MFVNNKLFLYISLVISFLFLNGSILQASQSEEQIKVKIIGKVAKFISWSDTKSDKFRLNEKYGGLKST